METVLSTVGLSMRYTNKLALDKLTLDLPQGKIVGLLGPNGSGKPPLSSWQQVFSLPRKALSPSAAKASALTQKPSYPICRTGPISAGK